MRAHAIHWLPVATKLVVTMFVATAVAAILVWTVKWGHEMGRYLETSTHLVDSSRGLPSNAAAEPELSEPVRPTPAAIAPPPPAARNEDAADLRSDIEADPRP